MSESGFGARRTAAEKLAAWLVTGPLGHLYGFLAEAAVLWVAWARGEARRRLERGRPARAPGAT